MTKAILLGAAALALTATAAGAADDPNNSANLTLPLCRVSIDGTDLRTLKNANALAGVGYCAGVVEGLAYAGSGVCAPPSGYFNDQAIKIVVAYIDARPARLHEPFLKLAVEALRDAWPCK
jgi:hypothetical protein